MHLEHGFNYNLRRTLSSQNHTTTIIIIVFCAVAGTSILYCLFRFFRHSWARGSTPLPPMQPVASHREQRLTEFVERINQSTIIYPQPSYLSPPFKSSPAASDSSSIHITEESFISRKSSLYTTEKSGAQHSQGPSTEDEEISRIPDVVRSHARHRSNSFGSLPPSIESSLPLQTTFPYPYPHHAAPAVSKTSIRSVRSFGRNTIIGVPHGPHSQVNVILPSPLAPSVQPYMSGPEAGRLGLHGTQTSVHPSLVDMWAPRLHRSVSSDHIGKLSSRFA